MLLLAVAGPALWLGGVKPWTIPCFAVVVFGLLLRRCLRGDEPLRVPALWWMGLVLAGLTALQWMPLPPALLELLAPRLQGVVGEALVDTGLGWRRLSVDPAQTGLECARVLALTGLFIAAAQLSWRLVATYVGVAATLVSILGLIQKLAGATAIYGLYAPRQALFSLGQELGSPLLTSFVNANHQSGLLLLGVFSTAAMVVDLRGRAGEALDHRGGDRLNDRAVLAGGALAIQVTALVLSMSRGALAAGLLAAPLAAWAVGFSGFSSFRPGPGHAQRQQGGGRRRKLGLAAVLALMVGLAVTQGAWGQLASLREFSSFSAKLRIAREGLGLVAWSPVLGTGRGTFVDLFPLVDSAPGPRVFTHLESTPVAVVVEWGPLVGGGFVIALGLWWLRSFQVNPSPARRVAMCGLLALGIQSWADFSLEFLGVAAPALALAGALGFSAGGGRRKSGSGSGWFRRPRISAFPVRPTMVAAFVGLICAEGLALSSLEGSWSRRRARDLALLDAATYEPARARAALESTPLDPLVHRAIAQAQLRSGDPEAALVRAEVAARLRPTSVDIQLLAAVAAHGADQPLVAIEHLRAALEQVRAPVPKPLIAFLLTAMPEPRQLAAVAPEQAEAWTALAWALVEPAPEHARALGAARAAAHPEEPEPLRLLVRVALARENPGLALHHARLLVALEPESAAAIQLRALARVSHRDHQDNRNHQNQGRQDREQLARAIEELEAALEAGVDDPGVVEEYLVHCLLWSGEPEALDRAEALARELSTRRAEAPVRRRRQVLVERVQARGR